MTPATHAEIKATILRLLSEHPKVNLVVDTGYPACVVPLQYRYPTTSVNLQIGLNFPIPIPDLDINDHGIACTLSFQRRPFFCVLPYGALYGCFVIDTSIQYVWREQKNPMPCNVPVPTFNQSQPLTADKKKRPAWLKGVIVGGKK